MNLHFLGFGLSADEPPVRAANSASKSESLSSSSSPSTPVSKLGISINPYWKIHIGWIRWMVTPKSVMIEHNKLNNLTWSNIWFDFSLPSYGPFYFLKKNIIPTFSKIYLLEQSKIIWKLWSMIKCMIFLNVKSNIKHWKAFLEAKISWRTFKRDANPLLTKLYYENCKRNIYKIYLILLRYVV